jgi:hypothetical protein
MRNFQCYICERFHGNSSKPTCDDFPKGIPAQLWLGQIEHNTTFLKSNEKLFKPVKEVLK